MTLPRLSGERPSQDIFSVPSAVTYTPAADTLKIRGASSSLRINEEKDRGIEWKRRTGPVYIGGEGERFIRSDERMKEGNAEEERLAGGRQVGREWGREREIERVHVDATGAT